MAKDLDLVEEGKKRGALNQPPRTAKPYDDVEYTIIERVEEEKRTSQQSVESSLQLFAGRLSSLDFEDQFGLINLANSSSVSDFKAEVAVGVDELHGLRKSLNDAEREHAWFKDKHNLIRAARIPEGGAHILRVSLLLFLFLIETGMNGNFLAKGNVQGFFGGIVEAAAFSFVNIGIALLAAIFCARLVTHRSLPVKTFGAATIVAYVGLALTINLALAHYREVTGSLADGAGNLVISSMKADPAGLADIKSWLLFMVGMLFSIMAFIDGWFVLDPYVGYAGVEKRRNSARENYKDGKADLIERLQEVRDEHNDKVKDIIKGLGQRQREHRAIVDHRGKLLSLFAEHQNQLERACNQLISKYREANVQTRTTAAPKYFSNPYHLEKVKPKIAADGEWGEKELSTSIRDAQAKLNEQVRLIGRECENGISAYQELDKLHPDKIDG
ncbi:MARVEL domain-containing protein [Mesorhizobium sp. DCY119]|uniref:MARVEL domain-containing protein n=1 Tax=Mesorhizobium sp. DCY119 TaxID=2108445 RepID=UPI0032AE9B3B